MTGKMIVLGDATAQIWRGIFSIPQKGKAFTFCAVDADIVLDAVSIEDENRNKMSAQVGGAGPRVPHRDSSSNIQD